MKEPWRTDGNYPKQTGHWISELRKTLPDPSIHNYVGTDLNPALFPQSVPADTRFQVHNIAHEWPAELHSTFDLVHQRLTLPGAAPACPLPQAIRQLFRLVKPGGWIQLVEAEQEGPGSGPVFHEFLGLVRGLFDATGAGWHYARHMRGWLEAEGAVDVGECVVDLRFGAMNPDPKMADMSATSTAKAMEGLVGHAKRELQHIPPPLWAPAWAAGWRPMANLILVAIDLKTDLSVEQMDTLGDRLLEELVTKGARYRIRCVWGRKKNSDEA